MVLAVVAVLAARMPADEIADPLDRSAPGEEAAVPAEAPDAVVGAVPPMSSPEPAGRNS